MKIEYFFDFSCPYAYLGSTQIEALAAAHSAELEWKPMLLGGVFRAVGTPMNLAAGQLPAKARHNAEDMMRWAKAWHVPLQMPKAHPMRTLRALRALLAAPNDSWPKLIHGIYKAYWVRGQDIRSAEVLAAIFREAGLGEAEIETALAANEREDIRRELQARTEEAIERGCFGAPSIFVSGGKLSNLQMFWGQDRFPLIEHLLQEQEASKTKPTASSSPSASAPDKVTGVHIDFWYDFASPFAYLGAMRISALATDMGATLTWKPLLLGALFKSIGTDNVPLQSMSPAKRSYLYKDLQDWAAYQKQPLRFASAFPLRTVTALRLALLAGERIGELSELLFTAAWSDDRDISDAKVLAEILNAAGFAGDAMLERCSDNEVKMQLRQNTAEAEALGVFGVPTSIITIDGESQLYWGQDRFALIEEGLSEKD